MNHHASMVVLISFTVLGGSGRQAVLNFQVVLPTVTLTPFIGQETKMKVASAIKIYLFLLYIWDWRTNLSMGLSGLSVSQTQPKTPSVI